MPDSTETIDKSETINTQSSGGPAPAPGFLRVIWQALRGTQLYGLFCQYTDPIC
jgi:hypothetical protein